MNQNKLISALTGELPELQTRLSLSLEDTARAIGGFMLTYGSIEIQRRDMFWTVFAVLIGFRQNNRTAIMLELIPNSKESLTNAFEALDKTNESAKE